MGFNKVGRTTRSQLGGSPFQYSKYLRHRFHHWRSYYLFVVKLVCAKVLFGWIIHPISRGNNLEHSKTGFVEHSHRRLLRSSAIAKADEFGIYFSDFFCDRHGLWKLLWRAPWGLGDVG